MKILNFISLIFASIGFEIILFAAFKSLEMDLQQWYNFALFLMSSAGFGLSLCKLIDE